MNVRASGSKCPLRMTGFRRRDRVAEWYHTRLELLVAEIVAAPSGV